MDKKQVWHKANITWQDNKHSAIPTHFVNLV